LYGIKLWEHETQLHRAYHKTFHTPHKCLITLDKNMFSNTIQHSLRLNTVSNTKEQSNCRYNRTPLPKMLVNCIGLALWLNMSRFL